ncbi:MAG: Hsp20/alpha crystallin family protein [Thermodesulfobacteriota bacterium]
MSIEKWNPFKEIDSMRREMDRLWDQVFPTSRRFLRELPVKSLMEKETAVPAIDIVEKAGEVEVRAEMPGVDKDDIEISLQENRLTITGKLQKEKETKDEDYYYRERSYNSISRSIDIPYKVNPAKIKAGLKNGILTVHLPKAAELQPKKIKVEVS